VTPSKGKQTCVILDDDEVSSDEDEPLQKRLQQLSDTGSAVLDEAAVADKEAVDKRAAEEATAKRATEEAMVKRAMEERATVEAAVKAAAAEAAGVAGGSPAPDQEPSATGAKRAAAPSGSTPPANRPYRGVWKHRFVQLFLPLFCVALFSYYPFFQGTPPPARPP
jgi:cobalamin biosynthesis Mg chelatase CobN